MELEMSPMPEGQFKILYFGSASSYTSKHFESIPAPLRISRLYDLLELKYRGITENVLNSCLVTINLDYVDIPRESEANPDRTIKSGDEVGIIPPVSAG
ncbi:unnamed protein product [Blumeria hordei]|uniref:Molybdopterin synthase sulfur carrier subunit n=1 Tax=Blumeria hordei TaxID=2867405 RepID=A0A383UUG8_BLUHO|nr:unnamed protein product [Blumeria hordei]